MKYPSCKLFLSMALAAAPVALADDTNPFNVSVSTLITTTLSIEGLTNDNDGYLYTPGRQALPAGAGLPCPVWRTPIENPALTVVGLIPAPSPTGACSPSGLAFDSGGVLYVTQTDTIYKFKPLAVNAPPSDPIPVATVFATGVPGTNGLAFDEDGNLWTADGTTGQGRVWKISTAGVATLQFIIPPMANEVNLVAGVGGVGRDVRSLPPGAITVTPTSRNAQNTLGSQPLVGNGLAFDHRGNLFIADTARGAIWRVRVRSNGTLDAQFGCDTTYPEKTLCMDHVFAAHPMLEGVDGIVLDVAGNIWADANERNAIVVVYSSGNVAEIFRNPPDPVTRLRNASINSGAGQLETPTSPVLVGHKFCTANSDGNRRDNFPSSAGEIGAGKPLGKISCIDQRVRNPGMRLPVR